MSLGYSVSRSGNTLNIKYSGDTSSSSPLECYLKIDDIEGKFEWINSDGDLKFRSTRSLGNVIAGYGNFSALQPGTHDVKQFSIDGGPWVNVSGGSGWSFTAMDRLEAAMAEIGLDIANIELIYTYLFGTGEENILGNTINIGLDPSSAIAEIQALEPIEEDPTVTPETSTDVETTFNGSFVFGGSACKNCVTDPGWTCSVSNVTADNMKLRWGGSNLSTYNGRSDIIANLFIKVGSQWKGGKFEWVPTDRNSRSFENIYNHYNGWDLTSMPNPATCVFFAGCPALGKRTAEVQFTWRWNSALVGSSAVTQESTDSPDYGLNTGKITSDLFKLPISSSVIGMKDSSPILIENNYPKFKYANVTRVSIPYPLDGVTYYTQDDSGALIETEFDSESANVKDTKSATNKKEYFVKKMPGVQVSSSSDVTESYVISGSGSSGQGSASNEKDIDPSIPLGKSEQCTHASCWNGNNAEERMMNILSPRMDDGTFNSRVNFMSGRGVNCCHLFVSNQGDGEYSGYSIYGPNFDWTIDSSYCSKMLSRIRSLKNRGWKIILWLAADDSNSYNSIIRSNPEKYFNDLKTQGFFKYATTVCIGLEVNEYWSNSDVSSMISKLRKYYPRKIGVHTGNYNITTGFSSADILFLQIDPDEATTNKIRSVVSSVKRSYPRKLVNMFELSRHADRGKCNTAISAGAFGVGNW